MEQNNIHPREVASEILSEYLLNDFDGLIEAGTNLDNLVRRELQKVGNRVLENLYQTISERLSLMYKEQGYHIEQHKKVPFKTLYGDVEVASPYLRKAGEQEGVRPMKEVMGVIGKGYSGGLDRALIDFGSEKSFRRGMAQLEEHYNVEISVSSMIRHTESAGEEGIEYLEACLSGEHIPEKSNDTSPVSASNDVATTLESGLPSQDEPKMANDSNRVPTADEIVAELDGCEIRTGIFEWVATNKNDGSGETEKLTRTEKWREVRTGLVRPMAQDSPTYICQIGSYPELCVNLEKAAKLRGLTPETQVIAPGDGGNGLMEEMRRHFQHFQYVLDTGHLASHFYETAQALGIEEKLRTPWVKNYMDKLWNNEVEDVLTLLENLNVQKKNDRLRRLIAYLIRFKDAVNYGEYKAKGWPVGSGEIESAHRYIPQERLKIPGACWHPDTVNSMLSLRVIKANGWWNDFWGWLNKRRRLKMAA